MPAILDSIFETLFKNPLVSTYWKDKEGNYENISENFLIGYDNAFQEQDIIGRKDIDLWDGHAPSFHVNDQRVIYYEKLAKGMTLKQIASTLDLSPRTVEHYLDTVKMKLNCANRYELVKKAIELGL